MENRNYTARFTVEQDPPSVYAAINNVRGWWSEGIEGRTTHVGDRFTHRVLDLHRCDLEVAALDPGREVAWVVIDNYFNFTKDETEWKGTRIVFQISGTDAGTEVRFTHVGLVPEYECFDVCSDGWRTYLESLRQLIATGRGNPNIGEAKTDSERLLVQSARIAS